MGRTMLPGLSMTMNSRSLSSSSIRTGMEDTGGSCRCTTFLHAIIQYSRRVTYTQLGYALNPVPVLDDRLGSRYFAIHSRHARLERIPLSFKLPISQLQCTHTGPQTHIILHRPVPKLRRHDLQQLPPKPPPLRHARIRVPIRRALLQPGLLP